MAHVAALMYHGAIMACVNAQTAAVQGTLEDAAPRTTAV